MANVAGSPTQAPGRSGRATACAHAHATHGHLRHATGAWHQSPSTGHNIYPYLLRHVSVTQANHVWALDTTYIPMECGFVSLTEVVDVASRRVLAHKVATTLEACHAAEVM